MQKTRLTESGIFGMKSERWAGKRRVGAAGGSASGRASTTTGRARTGRCYGSRWPCLTCSFLAWAAWQGLTTGATPAVGTLCIAAVFGLIFLGGWWAYRVCRVETDEDGLTQVTPWGRRRLAWGQVEDYYLTGEYNTGIVQGGGERFRFSSGIVGYEELKEEIARRAVGCGGRTWERNAAMADGRR